MRIWLSFFAGFMLLSCYNQRPELNIETYKEADLKVADIDPLWEETGKGLHLSFGSTDVRYDKYKVPMESVVKDMTFTAWRGERVNAQAVLWSVSDVDQVECVWQPLVSELGDTLAASQIKSRFVRYVLSDEYGQGCGPREKDDATVHLVADVLDDLPGMDMDAMTVRPVWISIDVPQSAEPGMYTTSFKVYSRKNSPQELRINLKVQDKVLPSIDQCSFDLNLKQDPLAIAMWHDVKPWSKEHFEVMRPYMKMLVEAGQKTVSCDLFGCTGLNDEFSILTSMVKWIKTSRGKWQFDFSILSRWIDFMAEMGVDNHINIYSILPVNKQLFYLDEKSGETNLISLTEDSNTYRSVLLSYFNSLKQFLSNKGWLRKSSVVIKDANQQHLTDFIYWMRKYEPDFNIALLTKRYRPELLDSVRYLGLSPQYITAESMLEMQQVKGVNTSLVVDCSLERPNLFSFSSPAEAIWFGWFAASHHLDGMYYAGFNDWTANPLIDGRNNRSPAGANCLIYPGCRSSIRFERLLEGIQDYEKILILKKQLSKAGLEELQQKLFKIDAHRMESDEAAMVVNAGRDLLNILSDNE